MMLALTAIYDWEIEQMDVVTTFLNPKVDGDVYMALPQGIEVDKPQVCKLRKSLYGLKQAPRLWYNILTTFSDLSVSNDASMIRMSTSRQALP